MESVAQLIRNKKTKKVFISNKTAHLKKYVQLVEDKMLENFALGCIKFRKLVLAVVAVLTCIFGYFAQNIEVKTVFDDLMPTSHPYIQIHNEYKETFGGTNIITFMIQAEEGDIFQPAVLKNP
ncbi:MAG: hypothetical protein R3E57_09340 [Porticoccaceae bacterium]